MWHHRNLLIFWRILKMETTCSPEMSVNCYQTTWCHILQEVVFLWLWLSTVKRTNCVSVFVDVGWKADKAVANVTIEGSTLLAYDAVVMFLLDCLSLKRRHCHPLKHQELPTQQYSATLHKRWISGNTAVRTLSHELYWITHKMLSEIALLFF